MKFKEHFKVHEGTKKYYVIGLMGESQMTLPITNKSLAKKVAYDLNKQLNDYAKNVISENNSLQH